MYKQEVLKFRYSVFFFFPVCFQFRDNLLKACPFFHFGFISRHLQCGNLGFLLVLCCIIWASLVAQMVKNLPAMQKTWAQFLDWEDSLEKGMATHSSILTWRVPWTEEPAELQFMGCKASDTTEQLTLPLFTSYCITYTLCSVHVKIAITFIQVLYYLTFR